MPLAREAGRRVPSLVSLIDLMPTFSALGGVEPAPGVLGRDLSSALHGEGEPDTVAVFADGVNGRPGVSSVRTLSHKLIRNETGAELELYDLSRDPEECSNLGPRDAAALSRLESYLREHDARSQARGALAHETSPIDGELLDQLKALGYVQ
jgi:arylsulfatase A-like enzyme